ncbi:hypothetical protein CBS9595_004000 [Malassezia furfur]|nr:hypothetical protein CBS9595_004000 [Malassezia furfur]
MSVYVKRLIQFTTVDWVVDGRRERVKMMRQEEEVQRLAEQMHERGSMAWRALNLLASRLPLGEYMRAGMQRVGAWAGPFLWQLHTVLLSAAENAVVLLVGILIGLNMAIISVVTEWASDLKQGYCSTGWWLNKKFCCWEQMDPTGPGAASVPVGIAAAAAQATATAPSSTMTLVSSALAHATQLARRANGTEPAAVVSAMEETCAEWVEWSHWTLPAYVVWIAMSVLFASVCATLVKHYAPYAAGSGISEIKCVLSGFIIDGFLSLWTLVIKSIGLPLAIASGLSVGKEGPAVHVACCMGNVVAGALPKLRELLTASSAAGVAVAFGSPIGGVLFALEEMTSHFPASTMWRTFLCALASTAALSFMNPFRTGKLVMFQVEYSRDWHYFELVFYVVIGIMGGLYGEYVVRYNLQVQRFRRKRLAQRGVQEAVVLALVTALITYFNRFLRLDMTESLEVLFRQCEGASDSDVLCLSRVQWSMAFSLFMATALRFVLVILSYGCKVPAGIFIPSMAVGATFGRMVGILVKALQSAHPDWRLFSACTAGEPCITPGTYAVMGAAGALAGVTRITVAVVVIMFELTGALTYILPIMLVVGTAKLVADLHGKGGVSDRLIKFNGFPYLEQEDHLFGTSVGALITHTPSVLYASGVRLDEVEALLARGTFKGFPVVQSQEDPTLLGYAARNDLRYALGKAKHHQKLAPSTVCRFHPGSSEEFALTTTQTHDVPPMRATGGGVPDYDVWESLRFFSTARAADDERARHEAALDVGDDDEAAAPPLATLELGAWVDPTPLIVQPDLDLEVVAELFRQMGPRVILVVERGALVGMVTIKDLLKHVASKEYEEHHARGAALPVTTDDTQPHEFDVGTGELEAMLDSLWLRFEALAARVPWPGRSAPAAPADRVPLRTLYEHHDTEETEHVP